MSRPGERREVGLDPAVPGRVGGQGRRPVVPAKQALIEQCGIAPGESVEVGAVRFGIDVVGDDLHPGLGNRVMVLLRRPLVRRDVLDPVADPGRRLRHAVAPHGHEGQVDVLPVPELPAGTGDPRQNPGQFGVSRTVRSGRGLMTGDWSLMAGERSLVTGH